MTTLSKLGAIGILLALSLPSVAQEKVTVVNLVVKHEGKEKPAPDHVTLSLGEHSVQIPVRDGRFEVPPEFVSAEKVTLAVDVEGYHILVPNLSGTLFTADDWTLLLAERRYDEAYQSAVPRGAVIRRSCILVFESPDLDPGRVVFCGLSDQAEVNCAPPVTSEPHGKTPRDSTCRVYHGGRGHRRCSAFCRGCVE